MRRLQLNSSVLRLIANFSLFQSVQLHRESLDDARLVSRLSLALHEDIQLKRFDTPLASLTMSGTGLTQVIDPARAAETNFGRMMAINGTFQYVQGRGDCHSNAASPFNKH